MLDTDTTPPASQETRLISGIVLLRGGKMYPQCMLYYGLAPAYILHFKDYQDGEKIALVAMRDTRGVIWAADPPHRHHHLINSMDDFHPTATQADTFDQGFVTSYGRYVDRVEAKRIAIKQQQLLPRAMKLRDLFSEDVW